MTEWGYRIIKHHGGFQRKFRVHSDGSASYTWFGLHEVYYGSGKIAEWDDPPIISGDAPKDIIETLEVMLQDAKKYPVLDEDDNETWHRGRG